MREKRHKKWSQECKQKQSLLFIFCNIFDLLISRIEKIAWWVPVFKPDFYVFSYNEQFRKIQRNSMDKFLLYHTFLMVIILKHLWSIPNILKWQDCKIFTKLVPSQTHSRSNHRRCSLKKMFLKICEISQENICVETSFK